MTTRVISDPESLARQARLMTAFETTADLWLETAELREQRGDMAGARVACSAARTATETALRIRHRLVALSGLTEGDVAVSGGLSDLMQRGPAGDTAWLPSNTVAPPVDYQTYATPVLADDEARVVAWLRWDLPEYWWTATHERLVGVARWLLALRAACWSGRWKSL